MNPRARRARALLESCRFGVLATQSRRIPGFPFASTVPLAADEQGRPLFLFSALAVHTKNLEENARASLNVFSPEFAGDPFGSERLTLLGEVAPVAEAERDAAMALYLARLPEAEPWLSFGDFSLYRMQVAEAYFIGGFGEMGWISPADYQTAA